MANVIGSNPVRNVSPIQSKTRPKGAPVLRGDELRGLLAKLRESEVCQRHDLFDDYTVHRDRPPDIGAARAVLDRLRSDGRDADRHRQGDPAAGKGLMRVDETKTAAGQRTLPLPTFAVTVLASRRSLPYFGQQSMVFPSTAGTWRDPDNFRARWREVREQLGVPDATSHSFRKTVATLIDDEGLSARIGADHLGHSRVSMTQDKYMARGRVHAAVAELLDRTINDE
jgi:integrase